MLLATTICFLSHEGLTSAAEPDFPSSLLGFIKPGMLIGLRTSQADSLVSVEIYDEEQFRIATDARRLKLEELEKKYPSVSEKAAKALATYQSSLEVRRSGNVVRGTSFVFEPSIELDVDRTTTLCTVLHVNGDYFLVTYGDDNSRKQAIAKQAVTRIRWVSDDVRFKTSLRTVSRAE